MAYFTVTTVVQAENGVHVFFVFRPDDETIRTPQDFSEAIAEDGSISGVRWKFRREELTQPTRIVLGQAGLVTAIPFSHPCLSNVIEPKTEDA